MKKIFLLLVFVLAVFSLVEAQETEYKVYCELHLIRGFKGCEASVDLGNKYSDVMGRYDYIGDDNGDKKNFYSPIDILNYMSKCGWNIEYKVTNADSLSHGSYLLSKFVNSENEITEGMNFYQRKGRNKNGWR